MTVLRWSLHDGGGVCCSKGMVTDILIIVYHHFRYLGRKPSDHRQCPGQGCAIVETGSRYQYQYSMTLHCNTNINNKSSGFATSIPISILVQLIQQYQYWYQNHFLQICNININNNIKSLTLAIPITPQYHLILQYLGININIWFNNSTIKCFFRCKFYTF